MRADVGELRHGLLERYLKREVVDYLYARELLGLAVLHLLGTHDGVQVIRDYGRGGHRGIADALPAALEARRVHGVAVVELGALYQVEREHLGVVADIPPLCGLGHDVAQGPVVAGKGVEQRLRNLHALGLLGVVGIDGHGVGDEVLKDVATSGSRCGLTATLARGCVVGLLAASKCGDCAGSNATLQERAAVDVKRHSIPLSFSFVR